MKLTTRLLTLGILVLALGACSSGDLSTTDSGGVILTISDFDGLPIGVSASDADELVQIVSLTVDNIAANPNGATSSLMNVEIQSYEVTFTRADRGTRVPPKLVEYVFGSAPVNGTFQLDNGPIMRPIQFNSQPLLDLKNLGLDPETGSQVIRLTVGLRFFGRTLAGQAVASNTAYFTIDVTP